MTHTGRKHGLHPGLGHTLISVFDLFTGLGGEFGIGAPRPISCVRCALNCVLD